MTDDKAQDWGTEMDPDAHLATYEGFITGTKWGTAALVILLVLMAIFLL